jgi:multidrug efflux pump subunit AcrB
MPQIFEQPALEVAFDRERGARVGLTEATAASNLVTSLSSSTFVSPSFWINPSNGVNYFVSVQTPVALIRSIEDVTTTALGTTGLPAPSALPQSPTPASTIGLPPSPTVIGDQSTYLQALSTVTPTRERALINHYSVQPILDVQCSVDGRDLGGVASDIRRAIGSLRADLPKTSSVTIRGQSESMQTSFQSLAVGMVLAAALVYLLLVVLFQSWLDPFIIMVAVPGALVGVLWMLAITRTTLNIESLMGAIMAIGIAASNSILLVSFANDVRVEEGLDPVAAAVEAGRTRLRPVLMTALAMILGMLPMALALGEGGEQNAPLGRAVIGGLVVATGVTLFVVPVVYSLLRTKEPTKHVLDERFARESHGAEGQP